MLTHTIRALSLAGLLTIAHVIKPFSLENLVTFAVATGNSLTRVLPAKTLNNLQEASILAAIATSGLGERHFLAERTSDASLIAGIINNRAAAPKIAAQQAGALRNGGGKLVKISGQPFKQAANQLSANNNSRSKAIRPPSGFGGAPLPFVPGIESSLIPSTTYMALPEPTVAPDDNLPQLFNLSNLKIQIENAPCPQLLIEEKLAPWPEGIVFKQLDAYKPVVMAKAFRAAPIPTTGKACAQPNLNGGKAGQRSLATPKQSC